MRYLPRRDEIDRRFSARLRLCRDRREAAEWRRLAIASPASQSLLAAAAIDLRALASEIKAIAHHAQQ